MTFPSLRINSSSVIPSISSVFTLAVSPAATVTADLATPSALAISLIRAALA